MTGGHTTKRNAILRAELTPRLDKMDVNEIADLPTIVKEHSTRRRQLTNKNVMSVVRERGDFVRVETNRWRKVKVCQDTH